MSWNLRWALIVSASALALSSCATKSSPTTPTPASCTYAVSTTTLSFGAGGGPAAVTVTTGSQCAWTATSDRNWMTIATASGSGNGVVNVTVAANSGDAARAGTLTIGGQAVSVQQAGAAACSYTVTPASATFTKDAAAAGFDVATAESCAWTATSSASWVAFTSPVQGTGDGHVSYSVARNTDTAERKAVISLADRTVAITQAGDTGSCEYSVAPVQLSACMSSPATLTTTITTAASCSWTVGTDASWITLGGSSGTGSGVITFSLAPNWDAPRTGKVLVRWPTPTAGQNVVVSQAGCHYAVSTSAISVAVGGGTNQFDVLQESDPMECGGPLQNACQWTATSSVPWITITTSMPQAGDNPVHFSVAPNGTGVTRTGTITVRDKTVTITQAGI